MKRPRWMRHFWQYKSQPITIEAEPGEVIVAANALYDYAKMMEGYVPKKDLKILQSISTKLFNAAQFDRAA